MGAVANHHYHRSDSGELQRSGNDRESFNREMRELEEMLSKLNPMAEEFVPPSLTNNGTNEGFKITNINANGNLGRWKKNNYNQWKRRLNSRQAWLSRKM